MQFLRRQNCRLGDDLAKADCINSRPFHPANQIQVVGDPGSLSHNNSDAKNEA